MRKRKRGQGSYIDDETGNHGTFETTKAAKRAHQRSGTWYKAPTDRELRIWDREDAQQNAAEKIQRRELNKKINAEKRAVKVAREQELKRKMFDDGKITFTQTLAKKDEDQLNLHGWFGGRKQADANTTSKILPPVPKWTDESVVESNPSDVESIAQRLSQSTELDKLLSEDLDTIFSEDIEDLGIGNAPGKVDISFDADLAVMNEAGDPFEIVEDSSAEDVSLEHPEVTELPDHAQASVIQSPSRRPPLSPLSKADLNTRVANTPRPGKANAQDKAYDANSTEHDSAAAQDLPSDLCTQDLYEADALFNMEKENKDPCKPHPPDKIKGAMPKKPSPASTKPIITPKSVTMSFGESNTDYDSLFAELDSKVEPHSKQTPCDYGDAELDDETLLSLSVAQIVSHEAPQKRGALKPADSFAVDGLSDNDLLEGLDDYERSQNTKKRRPLPWDKPEWHEALQANTPERQDISASQRTELLED